MNRFKIIAKRFLIISMIVAIGAMLYFRITESYKEPTVTPQNTQEIDYSEEARKEWQDSLRGSEEFQKRIQDELDRLWYEKLLNESKEQLDRLDNELSGLYSPDRVDRVALTQFLSEHNPDLLAYVDDIVSTPRWVEAVSITGKETQFCKLGVGAKYNNCGGIGGQGHFQKYGADNGGESIVKVAKLLENPLYKDRTIEQMNGIYCQDANRSGKKCYNWSEVIMDYIDTINWYRFQTKEKFTQVI